MRLFTEESPKAVNRDDDYGERSFPEKEKSSRSTEDRHEFETIENCRLLENTLSMNDDLVREMNNYLDERSPVKVIADHSYINRTTSPLVTICALRTNRVSESVRFTIPWRSDDNHKRVPEFAVDARLPLDKCGPFGSSIHRFVRRQDNELGPYNLDVKRPERTSNDRNFDIAANKVGERLAANWREFRKTFAYLLRGLGGKIRDKDVGRNATQLSRYMVNTHYFKRYITERRL